MKLQIDLLKRKANLISPKPVRIKLIWLKDNIQQEKLLEGGTEKKKTKNTFYERMFKIDTRMKGKLTLKIFLIKYFPIFMSFITLEI